MASPFSFFLASLHLEAYTQNHSLLLFWFACSRENVFGSSLLLNFAIFDSLTSCSERHSGLFRFEMIVFNVAPRARFLHVFYWKRSALINFANVRRMLEDSTESWTSPLVQIGKLYTLIDWKLFGLSYYTLSLLWAYNVAP